ncbi:MAG: hypothetical protein WDO06_02190 [Actinomycetota bacterium]
MILYIIAAIALIRGFMLVAKSGTAQTDKIFAKISGATPKKEGLIFIAVGIVLLVIELMR